MLQVHIHISYDLNKTYNSLINATSLIQHYLQKSVNTYQVEVALSFHRSVHLAAGNEKRKS